MLESDENVKPTGERLSPRSDSSDYVRTRWPMLPPHIREAIITLVDATLRTADDRGVGRDELREKSNSSKH